MQAYATTEYLKDAGTPARIERVDAAFRRGLHEAWYRGVPRPTVFLDRDGVINREVDNLRRIDDLQLIEGAASAIR